MTAIALTNEIVEIGNWLNAHAISGIDLPVRETRILADRLKIVARLSRSMEQELDVYRLCEAGKRGREIANTAAGDMLSDLVRDPDGKVLRPDFGGRDR